MRPGVSFRSHMTFRTLVPFFALAFGLTWGIVALVLLYAPLIEAVFGSMSYTHPFFRLAVYSPGLAGIFLVWWYEGVSGLVRYARRLTLWHMPAAWWAFLILGIPACFYIGAAFKGTLADPFPFAPWYNVLPALVTTLFIGPIEEFGWRGVALPLLQRRFAPLWSGLILGVIWGLWHIPAFLLSGTPQAAWSFWPFFVAVVAVSVILTAMFNAARGSILIAALFHFQTNGPAWPDAQPWDTLVFVAVAIIVVLLNRRTMLSRDGAVTNVLMSGHHTSINGTPAASSV
ncbi:MAG: CPBP family glutamic-type intramembrane protease [Chloroflexota bacterium]